MKPRIFFLTAALLTSGIHAAEPAPEDLLRQGLFEEEANRDFDKAAERYRSVIAAHDRQRALAATATFRLGEIARKKSDKEAAAAAFRTVIERFPEQGDLARLSRENLATLGMTLPAAEAPALAAPDDPEQAEIERLKTLARSSPDLLDGSTDTGWRPLHSAAAKGQVKVIAYLLENKADPNGRTTREQLTPLQLAAIHGRLAAVDALLAASAKVDDSFEMKADFEKDLPPKDQRANKASGDWTALNLAILYDRREVARTLIKASADLKKPELQFPVHGLLTPLTEAIVLERDEIAGELLAAGAPLTAFYPSGSTPLSFAISANPRMVPALLKAGADPNLGYGTERSTPLQTAAGQNRLEAAKLLLEAGADAKAVNAKGETALHAAYSPGMIEVLVAAGADPNAKDKAGLTPLDATAMRASGDYTKAFEPLLAKGAVAEDAEALLRRAQPALVSAVRERVVYPAKWQADAVLLTVADRYDPGSWIDRIETRPAPGSPPPSLAEGIALFYPSSNSGQTIRNIRIIRRDAEGRFHPLWDHTSQPDEKLPKELPALEWGDIVEVNLGTSSNELPLSAFQERITARSVTLRLGGIEFVRKLAGLDDCWLGNRDLLAARPSNRGRRIVQPGQIAPPQPRTRVPASISSLSVIPAFIDSSRISVTRKGVDQPILVDLAAKDARPFRLIEGDALDLVLKESVREEMMQNNKQLLLTTDFKLGGVVNENGLFETLAFSQSWQNNSSSPSLVDWSSVKILRGGDPAKTETLDLAALVPDNPYARDGQIEELAKVNRLQAGDWILIRLGADQPTEKERRSNEDILSRIQRVAQILQAPQPQQVPRPAVVPPPVQQPTPSR